MFRKYCKFTEKEGEETEVEYIQAYLFNHDFCFKIFQGERKQVPSIYGANAFLNWIEQVGIIGVLYYLLFFWYSESPY